MADAGYAPEEESLIRYFIAKTGASRETAIFYLDAYAWSPEPAVIGFLEEYQSPTLLGAPDLPSASMEPSPPWRSSLRSPVMTDSGNPPDVVDDPIGHFCHLTGTVREAGLFYLEGFKWNLNDAINGFLNNTLPPLDDTITPHLPPPAAPKHPPPPPTPPKRPRPQSPPPSSKSEEGSFTFPTLEALTAFRDQDGPPDAVLTSDMLKVVGAFVGEASEVPASAGDCANTSHVEGSSEYMEISAAPSTCEATLEIQLADGTETLLKFSSRDRIRDIHEYIDSSRPGERKDYQLVTKGSPQRELSDMDQTIEEAGIVGIGLTQKYPDPMSGKSSSTGSDSPVTGLIEEDPTITLTVMLSDGTVLESSFKRDQTIRDIHERIDEIRPDDNKNYYFLDTEAKELRDLDQTIEKALLSEPQLVQMLEN